MSARRLFGWLIDEDQRPVGEDDTTEEVVRPGGPILRERVKLVVVRVTRPEWVRLIRTAAGRDLGDVLREWAGLPPIRR
jgi:hypothetical protein